MPGILDALSYILFNILSLDTSNFSYQESYPYIGSIFLNKSNEDNGFMSARGQCNYTWYVLCK